MIVQMSGLGNDKVGRFGNQIFSYFFLKLVESELGCEIRHPHWMGETVFGAAPTADLLPHDAAITFEGDGKAEVKLEHQVDRNLGPGPELATIQRYQAQGTGVLEIEGSYQYHTGQYARHKDMFRRLFSLNPALDAQLSEALQRTGLADRPIVCLHIRRGDYLAFDNKHPLFWGVSFDAVARALSDLAMSSFKNALIYLCSDDMAHCQAELAARQIACISNTHLFSQLDGPTSLMVDFMMMARAQVLVSANSSLSVSAAMLNRQAGVFLRPCPRDDRYIAFDPWNAHVLLPKYPYQFN